MKKGIRVLGVMIFSILISISFVSAGFWGDLFSFGDDSDLEGELAESVDVSITLTNTPPVIIFWMVPAVPPIPTEAGTTDIDIVVTIQDENGIEDLTDAAAIITASVTNTLNHPIPPMQVRATAGECVYTTPIDANTGTFTCTIAMQYWDIEGSGWIVEVSAADKNDPGTPVVQASTGPGNYPFFNYGHYLGMVLPDYPGGIGSLGWSGVQGGTVNQGAVVNLEYPLKVGNAGNAAIIGTVASESVITIEGKNLLGVDTPANELLAQSFAADDVDCDGIGGDTPLVEDDDQAIEGVSYARRVITDPTAVADVYFCINSIVSSLGAGTLPFDTGYSTGVNPWIISAMEGYTP